MLKVLELDVVHVCFAVDRRRAANSIEKWTKYVRHLFGILAHRYQSYRVRAVTVIYVFSITFEAVKPWNRCKVWIIHETRFLWSFATNSECHWTIVVCHDEVFEHARARSWIHDLPNFCAVCHQTLRSQTGRISIRQKPSNFARSCSIESERIIFDVFASDIRHAISITFTALAKIVGHCDVIDCCVHRIVWGKACLQVIQYCWGPL